MPNKIKYTKEILEPIISTCQTFAEVLRKLGLRDAGGNYATIHRNIERYQISTEHMLHESINKGKEIKMFDGLRNKEAIKKRLLKERGYKCEGVDCGLSTWKGQVLCLEVDHIDGNNRNNTRSNLRLLCPNCHSQTPTWRNRKRF